VRAVVLVFNAGGSFEDFGHGGAGFTPLSHKVSNESWVETANCSFEAKFGWRLL
jgi:hypothetical protein